MNNLVYVIMLILFVTWGTAFFVFEAGIQIHILLVLAFYPNLFRLIIGKEMFAKNSRRPSPRNHNYINKK